MSDIGLRSLLISVMDLSFGIAVIFARFQAGSNVCSINEAFTRFEIGEARVSAYPLRTKSEIPSRHDALAEFNDLTLLYTDFDEVLFMPTGGTSSELSIKICKS